LKTIKYEVKSKAKASRTELLVRLVYWIPLTIVLLFLQVVAGLCWFLQLLVIIITGKRNKALSGFMKLRIEYELKMMSYYSLLTDERPEILPTK
jgi:hypothetical protein